MLLPCVIVVLAGCATSSNIAGLPEDPVALEHYNKGTAFFNAFKYDLAIRELELSAGMEPTSASTYLNLGSSYYFIGQYKNAEIALRKSANLNPGHYRTRLSLGSALYADKKFSEAAVELKKAIELYREIHTFFLQVISLMRSGDIAASRTLLAAESKGLPKLWNRTAAYLLGSFSEEDLLSLTPAQGTARYLVYLVVGANNVVKGDLTKAERYLRLVIDSENTEQPWPPGSIYYTWAKVTLEHIEE